MTASEARPDTAAGPFRPALPPEEGGYPGFGHRVEHDGDLTIERDVAVTLRDGVTIYVDVYRPVDHDGPLPVLIGWAQSFLPFEHRGRGMGVWTACFFLGQFTSPLLISLSRQAMGTMQGAFVVAAAIGIVGAVAVGLFATFSNHQNADGK